MKNPKIYNNTKGRQATMNEIAKYLILDVIDGLMVAPNEKLGCEHFSDKQLHELYKHLKRHELALIKKFNPNDNDIRVEF
jgi:hypothetical protein